MMIDEMAEEIAARQDRLRRELRSRGVDVAIITRPANIFYLSGFRATSMAAWTSRFHALLVPKDGSARLLARSLESESAKLQWTPEPILWADHEDPFALVRETVLPETGPAPSIAIETRSMTVAQLENLTAAIPDASCLDISGVVERQAASLSEGEIARMRTAAKTTRTGMSAGLEGMRPGRAVNEVIGEIHAAMYAEGQSDFEKSFVALWSGPTGGLMHDTRATEVLREGDLATIEVMGVDEQYMACSQTSVVVGDGQPASDVAQAYDLLVRMHTAAVGALRSGVRAGEVFAAANEVFRDQTGKDYFRRVGGSMGLSMFALDLVKDSDVEIPSGTPLLVQVLVNDPVLLTRSATMLVTDEGHEVLTPPLFWGNEESSSTP